MIPLVHEPSLREGLEFFLTGNLSSIRHGGQFRRPTMASTTSVASDAVDSAALVENPEVRPESTFTLITALCAEAAFLLPAEIFPEGDLIADSFLKASRNCLESYLEADLEQPNANSVTIRYFHSNCLHAAGKPKYSWHIFGEATRLAQVMQLNDQAAYEALYPVEAELRRRAFWIIYTGDKSAAILNNRPITIHKFSFELGITASYPAGSIITDNPPTSPVAVDNAQRQRNFVTGFNANIRLWQTASDLLLEIRMLQERGRIAQALQPQHPLLSNDDINSIDALYVRFITCLDDLPYYLQMDNFGEVDGDGYQSKRSATIQRVNLQVSFHCLRMVILQKLSALEIATQTQTNSHMLNLRKTEVARDMLRVIREAPFWVLQVNGEPCVCSIARKVSRSSCLLTSVFHRLRKYGSLGLVYSLSFMKMALVSRRHRHSRPGRGVISQFSWTFSLGLIRKHLIPYGTVHYDEMNYRNPTSFRVEGQKKAYISTPEDVKRVPTYLY